MTAEEMWTLSGLQGEYEAWAFGDEPDALAQLVLAGRKTATCSACALYEAEGEKLPQAGEYSVVLDGRENAVCIIQTTRVYLAPFCQVTADHARREGEGDLSLAYWRQAHKAFFTAEMAAVGKKFTGDMLLVCEEFEKVFPAP